MAAVTVLPAADQRDSTAQAPLVVCENVSRVYHMGGADVYAVRDVSCEVYRAASSPCADGRGRARRRCSTS